MAQTHLGAMKFAASRAGMTLEQFLSIQREGSKFCYECASVKPQAEFGRDCTRYDGHSAVCLACRKALYRRTYRPKGRKSKRGAFYAETRCGDIRQARRRVNHHVEVGLLPRPNSLPCMDCAHVYTPGRRRHEYDHHLGYGAEHQLDVQPVCTKCHAAREQRRRAGFNG
jgi:hypothetical protein